MRNSTRRRAFDSVRNVFGTLKDKFQSVRRRGLRDENLKVESVRGTSSELMAPLEPRLMMVTTPNLILVPNQSVGGNLQKNLTPLIVDISAINDGTLYAAVETSTVGQLYTLIRDPATGAALGVQQVGAIAEANGSAVFNLAHSLATNGDGFFVIGSSGESYVPFQTVGGDLGNSDPLSIKAMSISTDLLNPGSQERIFVIDSDGSSLRLFEITQNAEGVVTGYDKIGQITDPQSGIPILGMTSLAVNPTSNEIVSIGYRADQAAPSNSAGYLGDSFDVRALTVTPSDLTLNDQTFFMNRRDPFQTDSGLPDYELWRVTRDPLTNAVLATTMMGVAIDPTATGANILRLDNMSADPTSGKLYGIGLPFAAGQSPTIAVQGDLGDIYRVLDISATQFSSNTKSLYEASIDSIFAVVDNNTTADLYRIRQNAASNTPDPNSGLVDREGLSSTNPMERIGQILDTAGRPIYFAQAIAGTDISNFYNPDESSGNDDHRFVWVSGSASPTSGSPMSLYKIDVVKYAQSIDGYVHADEEYAVTVGTTNVNTVIKGLTHLSWQLDLWDYAKNAPGSDFISDTHIFYAIIESPLGDQLYQIIDSSNTTDSAGNVLPPAALDFRIANGSATLQGTTLGMTVSSLEASNLGGAMYALSGKVGDADRQMVTISTSGKASPGTPVDPYLRGLTFLNFPLPFGDAATKAQVYSVRGDATLPQNDQLWTQEITSYLYTLDQNSGVGSQQMGLLFNSSNPLAAPVDKTSPLTDSQIRDWQIRPEKSDGFFKAMAIDENGVIWVVFEYNNDASESSSNDGVLYLATIEEEFTRETDFGRFAQLNVRGELRTSAGPITNLQGLDFSRTGELIALDKPTTTSNRLIAINQLDPSNSLELVTDTTTSAGTANLMSVLAKHDTDGYATNALGRFITIVPDDIVPVDQLNSPVTLIPNDQRPYGQLGAQLDISDFVITSKVDFATGQGKAYAIDYSTGSARLMQLLRDASGQFVGSTEVFSGFTNTATKVAQTLIGWSGITVDPTGFLYGIATNMTSPRPTGAVDIDEIAFAANKAKPLDYGAGASVATSADGQDVYVITSGGLLYHTERDTTFIDTYYGQAENTIINNQFTIGAKFLLKGLDGKTAYSSFQGLEFDPNTGELVTTAIDGSDASRRVLLRLNPTDGSINSRQYIVDLSVGSVVLATETLLASLNKGTGVTLGTTLDLSFADGAVFSLLVPSTLRTISELQTFFSANTGGRAEVTIQGDGSTAKLVITDRSVVPTTMSLTTLLSTFRGGAGVAGGAATFDFNVTDSGGVTHLVTVSDLDKSGALTVDDVIASIALGTMNTVKAQIEPLASKSLQLIDLVGGGGPVIVSDIGTGKGAANLGIAQIVPPGGSTLNGTDAGPFRSIFSVSGLLATDLKFTGSGYVDSFTSTSSLNPSAVLTNGDFIGLTFSPDASTIYGLTKYKGADEVFYQRFVAFSASDTGTAVTITQKSGDLIYKPEHLAPEDDPVPANISGFAFNKAGQLMAIDHQGANTYVLHFAAGVGTAFTQYKKAEIPVRADVWDLSTSADWRVFSASATQLLMNADTLYKISPGTGGATRLTDLVTDAASFGIAQGIGASGTKLAFSPTGDLYVATSYYASSQLFKVTQDAKVGYAEQTLEPIGNTTGGIFKPGEVGISYASGGTSGAIVRDMEFTKTGTLVSNTILPFNFFVIPSETPFLMDIGLEDAIFSTARSTTNEDGSAQFFTSAINPDIVAFATDPQGLFYGVFAGGPGNDEVWQGKPDQLYISNSDQAIYSINATNANATVIQTLKDTSQVLQQPVADVFQSLLYLPNGQLYGTLKDVRNNNINRLVNFNTTAMILNGTYNRVGKSAGLITIDNGLSGFSNVNIDGLVFVNNKLLGSDTINNQLVTINFDAANPANSQTDLSSGLSSRGSLDPLVGLVSDNDGKVYSVFKNTAGPWQLWVNDFNQSLYVYSVKSSNAQATNLGKLLDFDSQTPYEPGSFAGLVYDSAASILYGVLRNDDSDGNKADNGDYLVTISTKGDAQVLSVGLISVQYSVSDVRPAVINSIEFRNGQIIAYDDSNLDKAGKGRQIITIDPANTSGSKVLVAGNQPGINYLDSSLVGLAVDPLKGRLYSIKPGDGVSTGLAKYDQLFLSDRLYSYDQAYSNLETDNTSAHQSLRIDLPGLLGEVWGVDPVTGITVANPINVRISEVFDSQGKSVVNNSGQFIFTTVAGIVVTVFEDGRVQLAQTSFYNGVFDFSFKATNGTLTTASNKVVISIPEVNEAPIGTKDYTYEVNRGQSVTLTAASLLEGVFPGPTPATAGSNDKYTWPSGLEPDATVIKEISQTLTLSVTSGVGGTASLVNGVVTFTPDLGFVGQAQFTYTVKDDGTTNGAANPISVTRTVVVFVGTRPQVLALTDIQPNPTKTPVTSIDVTFAAPIDPASFDFSDLILTLNGNTVTLDNSVVVTVDGKDNTIYHVTGLGPFTVADGNYQLTVDVTNIVDPTFNKKGLPDGNKSETWVMDTVAPVVSLYPAFDPNPRNTAGPASITVDFSEAIPDASTALLVPGLATFDSNDLLLTFNGVDTKVSGSFTVSPILSSKTQVGDLFGYTKWTITGLDALSTLEGTYALSILPTGFTDLAGNAGANTINDTQSFVVDKSSPQTKSVGPVVPDPRNIPVTTITVVFSEAIPDAATAGKVAGLATFDLADLALTLNGTAVTLGGAITVTADLSSATKVGALTGYTSWIISGLDLVTAAQGNYILTVLPTGLTDLAGNAGVVGAVDTDSWTMDTTAPTTVSVGPIVPNPRNTPAPSSVTVSFSEAIPDALFASATLKTLVNTDFTVTLNGVDLGASGSLTVAPVLASKVTIGDVYGYTQWTVSGLETVSSKDGNYVLAVDPTKVTDLASNAGTVSVGDSASWTMDTVAPFPASLGPVAPNPRNVRISTVTVVFSESIKASTLLTSNFTLTRDGFNVSLSSASIVVIPGTNNTQFNIAGLEPVTSLAGTYVLTVSGVGVKDLADNSGIGSATTSWIVDLTPPVVTSVGPVTPNPRNTSVGSVSVAFDKPIDANSFSTGNVSNVLSLMLNGNKVDLSGVVITPVAASKTSVGDLFGYTAFTIDSLNSATSVEGGYTLTVLGTQVQDVAGNFGKNDLGTSWTMDQTSVFISSLGANIVSPRNTPVSIVDVVFSESIQASTFTTSTLTLLRTVSGKSSVVTLTSDVQITQISSTQFQIVGLGGGLTSPEGVYTLSVDTTKIVDIAGNTGTGIVSKQWTMDTSAPVGALKVSNIVTHTSNPQTLTVTYTDQAGVMASSLKTGNINVFGPGGFSALATLVSITPSVDGSPITAVYTLSAPGGDWNALDNGTYNVVVNPDSVSDVLGQKTAQNVLGTFSVNIVGVPGMQVSVGGTVVDSPYPADFGLKNVGETSFKDFLFKNTGDGNLIITGVEIPAGFKILDGFSSGSTGTISPSGSDTLRIGLDTSTPRKTDDAQIIVSTNVGTFIINASGEVFQGINLVSGKAYSYIDATGDKVTVLLRGPGSGVLYFNGALGSSDASRLTLSGTTTNSTLAFTLASGKTTTLRDVAIGVADDSADQTAIGSFSAGSVNLLTSMRVAGAARAIVLGNVTNSRIEVGMTDTYTGQVSFTAKHIADTYFSSEIGVSTVSAWDWIESAPAGWISTVKAPTIGTLSILGNAASKITGNFAADVQVSGVVSGVSVNSFRATGAVSSRWTIESGGLNSFSAGTISGAVIVLNNGKINVFNTTANTTASGQIYATALGSANIRGPVFSLALSLGSNANPNAMDLQSLVIQNNAVDLMIDTKGKAGAITINGNLGESGSASSILIGSNLNSLSAYSATGLTLNVVGNVSSMRFTKALPSGVGIDNSTINAFAVSTFTVTGNIVDSQINLGDQTLFNAKDHVPVVGVAVPNTLPALTNFNTTGALIDSSLKVGGNARTVTFTKGMTESDFQVIGNVLNFTTGKVDNTVGGLGDHLIMADQIGTFRATAGITKGTINAVVINNLNVTGNMNGALVTLSLAPSTTLKALGALTVSGGMVGTMINSSGNVGNVSIGAAGATDLMLISAGSIGNITTAGTGKLVDSQVRAQGNIGQVSLAGMTDSFLYAGVLDTVTDLPDFAADFSNLAATISGVTIRTAGTTFIRSYIAAGTLTRVALKGVDPADPDGIFGVAASEKVGNYTATGQITRTNLTTPGDYNAVGSFRLRIV
jgi:hypothetical protein